MASKKGQHMASKTMTDFMISGEGLISDRNAGEIASWYKSIFSAADATAVELHMTLLRLNAEMGLTGDNLEPTTGLSRARLNILRSLYQAEEWRLSMSDLAKGLRMSPTNITRLVDSLVREKMVVRQPDLEDKRKNWAVLTEKGKSAFEAALPSLVERTSRVWHGLDERERRILIHLLSKVRFHLATSGSSHR